MGEGHSVKTYAWRITWGGDNRICEPFSLHYGIVASSCIFFQLDVNVIPSLGRRTFLESQLLIYVIFCLFILYHHMAAKRYAAS